MHGHRNLNILKQICLRVNGQLNKIDKIDNWTKSVHVSEEQTRLTVSDDLSANISTWRLKTVTNVHDSYNDSDIPGDTTNSLANYYKNFDGRDTVRSTGPRAISTRVTEGQVQPNLQNVSTGKLWTRNISCKRHSCLIGVGCNIESAIKIKDNFSFVGTEYCNWKMATKNPLVWRNKKIFFT